MANKKITDLQLASSVAADFSIPADDGIQTYRFTPSQMYDYLRPYFRPESKEIGNLQITTAVGSSALTIALKTNAGTDPSSTDKIRVGFRSATITSGAFVLREISSALSVVVSSGSTLGQISAQPSVIWVYLIDNAGTPELAVSHRFYPEDALVSTTAEGGGGAADSASVIYSTAARSSVAVRCIGYILNTQATAGTWASAGTQIQLMGGNVKKAPTRTVYTTGSGTYYTPAGCTYLRVRGVGAGGSGASSGTTTTANNGTVGGNTTFGTTLLVGNGGLGATKQSGGTITSVAGGTAALNGLTGIAITGGGGGSGQYNNGGTDYLCGGMGGSTPFGGGGGSSNSSAGRDAAANSGAGGGGAGANDAGEYSGAGGGGGGYFDAIISGADLLASFAYAVGASSSGGSAGTSGQAGGASGSGCIIIDEYY